MGWLLNELEAAVWIVVGVCMFGGAIWFGETVGSIFEKKEKPNDESH